MKMNKKEFIKELSNKTGYDMETCEKINGIVEETFFIGKKNKEKMIAGFMQELSIDEAKANEIYETVSSIIGDGIKEKLKHPFKSQD